jgi:hypothetical protein
VPRDKPTGRPKNDFSAAMMVDTVFVVFPLLILILAYGMTAKDPMTKILTAADWSFAASVLFGQSVAKFVAGMIVGRRKLSQARVTLVVVSVIGLLWAPSLLVLALMLTSATPPPF